MSLCWLERIFSKIGADSLIFNAVEQTGKWVYLAQSRHRIKAQNGCKNLSNLISTSQSGHSMPFTVRLDYSFKSLPLPLPLSWVLQGPTPHPTPQCLTLVHKIDPSTFNEMGSNHLELKLESIFWFSEVLGSLKSEIGSTIKRVKQLNRLAAACKLNVSVLIEVCPLCKSFPYTSQSVTLLLCPCVSIWSQIQIWCQTAFYLLTSHVSLVCLYSWAAVRCPTRRRLSGLLQAGSGSGWAP